MSEKIELIDAKDLPMTEEEDVTVLCVGADGEMKRRGAGSFGIKMSELDKKVAEKITAPATASVGQTIKVSAVDENGKPTAWEAVDTPVNVIIKITTTEDGETTAELIEGTYETIRKAYEEDKIINVLLIYIVVNPDITFKRYETAPIETNNVSNKIYTWDDNYNYIITPDNTIEID